MKYVIHIFTVMFGIWLTAGTTPHDMGTNNGKEPFRYNEPTKGVGLTVDPGFGKIPLYFIPNQGQVNERAAYYARASHYTLWLTTDGLVFDRIRTKGKGSDDPILPTGSYSPPNIEREVTRLVFLRANKNPGIIPLETTPHRVNYFIGNDPGQWRRGIPTTQAVMYKNIYKHIDLKVYGNERQIEYDWIVRAGGNPADICFSYRDVKGTRIDEKGDLVIDTGFGKIVHRKPYGYQSFHGEKIEVRSAFQHKGKNTYGFSTGKYNKKYELILDPVVSLEYSTYLGGSEDELFARMAVDNSGQVYLTGYTYSPDYPTHNAYQGSQASTQLDAIITKFNSTGTGLVFSSYFGGSSSEYFFAITVADNGDVYIGGDTFSSDLPAMNSYSGGKDAFLARFDATGHFLGGRYLGGTSEDRNLFITTDSSNHLWATGFTWSTNFPTVNPYQEFNPGGISVWVCKLSQNLNTIEYSTYLGGSGEDVPDLIAVDGGGSIYVTGRTGSNNFPLKNAWQQNYAGGIRDVFLTKFKPDGSDLVFSTLLGGSGDELAFGLVFDNTGACYIGGFTTSTDFPTITPIQATNHGNYDIFISKFSADGTDLLFSTYLGGSGEDWHGALAIDTVGYIYVAGSTYSPDFPVKNGFQSTYGGSRDGFLSIISPWEREIIYSTYFGGTGAEHCRNIGRDGSGNIYLAGNTGSTNLPVLNSYQPNNAGGEDAFVAKFSIGWNLSVQSTPVIGVPITVIPDDIEGNSSGNTPFTRIYRPGHTVTLEAPQTFDNKFFFRWSYNGNNYYFRSIQMDMGRDQTVIVEYRQQQGFSLSRDQLNFGAIPPGVVTGRQNFFIDFQGHYPINWTISTTAGWLSCSPASGTGNAEVTVSVNAAGLAPGTYHGTITVSAPDAANSPQTIAVTLSVFSANTGGKPFGYFETPVEGACVYSSIPVTGWALDDVEVENVKIYREEGQNLVYIGDAVFVEGARPDVEQTYSQYPNCYKAGWGYMMLTNFLPNGGNGTFKLHAVAKDKDGHSVTLGTKTITCNNATAVKPFGAIDTPAQGGSASGASFRNQGWVLTPLPNQIPKDGHTIIVWINGINIGHPVYNIYRADIAALFPGYANSSGAMAYFDFDTTAYESGVYTIQWTAIDSYGNVDGIGSRYFSIKNTGTGQQTEGQADQADQANQANHAPGLDGIKDDIEGILGDVNPIRVKRGWLQDEQSRSREYFPDRDGNISVEIDEVERLEIHLQESPGLKTPGTERTPTDKIDEIRWQGFHRVGDQLRKLPIGSWLDTGKGIFYWMPGPGFVGTYRLVFMEIGQNGQLNKKNILVKIRPRH